MKNKTNLSTRNLFVIIGSVLLLIGILYAIRYFGFNDRYSDINTQNDKDASIDYSPAEKRDKKYNDEIKNNLPKDDQAPENTDLDPGHQDIKSVTPVISAWGQPAGPGTSLHINGYIPGIIEKDGTCTVKLVRKSDGPTIIQSKDAIQNVQDTSCGQTRIDFGKLSTGIWSVTLSYSSSKSSGSSVATDIEVK